MWGDETRLEFVRERFKLLLDTHRKELKPQRIFLEKDQLLIHQGQKANYCFLLLDGKVAIQLRNKGQSLHTLAVLEAEEFLGDLALFGEGSHTCDVRVVSKSAEFFQLRGEDLIKTMIFDSELVIELLAVVSERCQKANDLIGLLLDGISAVDNEDHLSLEETYKKLAPMNYSFLEAALCLRKSYQKNQSPMNH